MKQEDRDFELIVGREVPEGAAQRREVLAKTSEREMSAALAARLRQRLCKRYGKIVSNARIEKLLDKPQRLKTRRRTTSEANDVPRDPDGRS